MTVLINKIDMVIFVNKIDMVIFVNKIDMVIFVNKIDMVLFVNKIDMVLFVKKIDKVIFVNKIDMVIFVNKIIMRSKSSLPMQLSCKLLSPLPFPIHISFPILCFFSCPFYNSRVKTKSEVKADSKILDL